MWTSKALRHRQSARIMGSSTVDKDQRVSATPQQKRAGPKVPLHVFLLVMFCAYVAVSAIAIGSVLHVYRIARGAPEWVPSDSASRAPLNNFAHFLSSKSNSRIRALQLSSDPPVWLFEDFASSIECRALSLVASALLSRSKVAAPSAAKRVDSARTSSSAYIKPHIPLLTLQLESRIAQLLNLSRFHGESFSVTRYDRGEYYAPHLDALVGDEYLARFGQRVATVLIFLSSDRSLRGGETVFHSIKFTANEDAMRAAGGVWNDGSTAKVAPRQGRALVWYNVRVQDGAVDERVLHEGAPVLDGHKMIATKWVRRRSIT